MSIPGVNPGAPYGEGVRPRAAYDPTPLVAPGLQPGLPPLRRMTRPTTGRVLVGVCAGIAEHLGVPVAWVRWGFVVATIAGGAGLAAYILLAVFTPEGDVAQATTGAPKPAFVERPAIVMLLIGGGLLAAGAFLLLGQGEEQLAWLRIGTVLPIIAVGAGVVIAWSHLDTDDRRAWLGEPGAGGRDGGNWRQAAPRIGGGIALAVVGLVVLVSRGSGTLVWDVALATAAVVVGLALILAPWAIRFYRRLQEEQAVRVRETERAGIAAHLHDSVLQTLALIQRSDDPARMAQLARAQERELRAWLYGVAPSAADTLAAAVAAVVHEVEDRHGVPIEVVLTGDRALDGDGAALVRAVREALLNAVVHGQAPVTAYVEVGPTLVEAFVRDRGPGFDPADIPPDRLGVKESIIGRLERHGGHARIRRLEHGTEVILSLPVASGTAGSAGASGAAGAQSAPTPTPSSAPSSATPVAVSQLGASGD